MPGLVIFDCDGVLVDSEPTANRVLSEDVTAAGWPMTATECTRLFKGGRLAEIQVRIEDKLCRKLGADWSARHYERLFAALANEVRAIDGIATVLDRLDDRAIPYCVASQGSVRKMHLTLGASGLLARFEERIFSADMVARPKPAPDLFLHAAAEMGTAPAECIVIEDSPTGVGAAAAAGMTVLGFAAAEEEAKLEEAGAGEVFRAMSALPDLLGIR